MSRASGPILAAASAPHKATTSPIVTGTSVLAVKYKDGVMIATDTLGSYGSLARYTELRRIRRVGDFTMVAASGEYSDFQYIMDLLSELVMEEQLIDDNAKLTAPEIHSYLTRIVYQRRNKFDPFWNTLIVAGVKDGKATLGYIDQLGTSFSDDYACTGFGMHLAMPLIREKWRPDLTEEEARKLLEDCMRILYYRDCRAINKIQIGTITASGVNITDPYSLDTKWDYKSFVQPKAGADTGGSW